MGRIRSRIIAVLLAFLLVLCVCFANGCALIDFVKNGISVSDTDDNVSLSDTPKLEVASEQSEGNSYPEYHIVGLPLPEDFGDGYMDCEAAFWLINQVRLVMKCKPVQRSDAQFQNATVDRLDEVVGDFSHTRPNGQKYSTLLTEHGINYSYCNENLASGQFTAEHVVCDWINSPSHYANLLDEQITHVCIACTIGEDGLPYWVFEGVAYSDEDTYVPIIEGSEYQPVTSPSDTLYSDIS